MSHSTKHEKSQRLEHGRDPEPQRRGQETGGREPAKQVLKDVTPRGSAEDQQTEPSRRDPSSRSGSGQNQKRGGGESEQRRRGHDAGGGRALNQSMRMEEGELRDVDEFGQVTHGTHGDPAKKPSIHPDTTARKREDEGEIGSVDEAGHATPPTRGREHEKEKEKKLEGRKDPTTRRQR